MHPFSACATCGMAFFQPTRIHNIQKYVGKLKPFFRPTMHGVTSWDLDPTLHAPLCIWYHQRFHDPQKHAFQRTCEKNIQIWYVNCVCVFERCFGLQLTTYAHTCVRVMPRLQHMACTLCTCPRWTSSTHSQAVHTYTHASKHTHSLSLLGTFLASLSLERGKMRFFKDQYCYCILHVCIYVYHIYPHTGRQTGRHCLFPTKPRKRETNVLHH